MNFEELHQHLSQLNPSEIAKKADMHKALTQNHPLESEKNVTDTPHVMEDLLFIPSGQRIAFYQNERFTHVKQHRHSFIELIYVYSGSCEQVINGQKLSMQAGEICLLDTNVTHTISSYSESDIVINCLMSKSYFDTSFLSRLSGNDLLSQFFVHSIFQTKQYNHFIYFQSSSNDTIPYIMKKLLCEYLDEGLCKEEIINSYMIILFSELLRIYKFQKTSGASMISDKDQISDILSYIQKNYMHTDLTSTAAHFNFNPSYLSRLIKQSTGNSFIDILHSERIKRSCILLETTDISIWNLIHDVGYSNSKYFYQLFKKYQGCTPLEYRKKMSSHSD